MTALAEDFTEAIDDLITEVGGAAVIRSYTLGPLDPLNPGSGKPRTPVNTDVTAAVYDYEEGRIDGTVVQKGDKEAIVSMKDETIDIDTEMLFIQDSIEWMIIETSKPKINGTIVTVILQVRK